MVSRQITNSVAHTGSPEIVVNPTPLKKLIQKNSPET